MGTRAARINTHPYWPDVGCSLSIFPSREFRAIATIPADIPVARPPRPPGFSIGEFQIHAGRVTLRKTGNSAVIDRRLLVELLVWWRFQLVIRAIGLWARLTRPRAPAIWFAPERPHSRYMVQAAAILGGMRTVEQPGDADVAFAFDDATVAAPASRRGLPGLNFGCADIGKSRVAAVFEAAFGYPLAVDPRAWVGPVVEKSEANGTHDGRVVECPMSPRAGRVYQRMVDTVRDDGFAYDLRTHVIDHLPVIVWEKRRVAERRFLPPNVAARMLEPELVFSGEELAAIGRFTRAMGADWCGLDILRDRDGRIYVVDLNKTDAGPIIALSLRAQVMGTLRMARALRAMVTERALRCNVPPLASSAQAELVETRFQARPGAWTSSA